MHLRRQKSRVCAALQKEKTRFADANGASSLLLKGNSVFTAQTGRTAASRVSTICWPQRSSSAGSVRSRWKIVDSVNRFER